MALLNRKVAKPMMISALMGLWASTAQAAITVQDVVKTYQDQAYSGIEVKEGPTQIKVEAAKDGVKIEVIYDKATGGVVKQESEAADATASGAGVEVATTDHDFTDDQAGEDASDDNSAGDVSDDTDSADDNSGTDDGAGHDVGDDNGDDHADDNATDDNGSDNSGADDSGSDDGADHDAGDDHGGDEGHDDSADD